MDLDSSILTPRLLGLMALTGLRPAEIFFSASFSLPKKIIAELAKLRSLKSFASPDAVNTATSPQLPKYVSAAFGCLALPWKPGHLRSSLTVAVEVLDD